MPSVVRNRRQPWELSEDDVTAALARIGERDEELGREAEHVYNTLTWDEGPGQIGRAGVQDWLWYRLPTKYMTDEVGYMGRLAETAAVLFDDEFRILRAALIPASVVRDHSKFIEHTNSHKFLLRDAIWDAPGVIDATERLRAVEGL